MQPPPGPLPGYEGGRLRLALKGRAALRKPPAEVIDQLGQCWLTHAMIDEFSRIEEIKGQRPGKPSPQPRSAARRSPRVGQLPTR